MKEIQETNAGLAYRNKKIEIIYKFYIDHYILSTNHD